LGKKIRRASIEDGMCGDVVMAHKLDKKAAWEGLWREDD
jgi:hypothetical protein